MGTMSTSLPYNQWDTKGGLTGAMALELIRTIGEFRRAREDARSAGSLGFVPTMGYLHEGHVALVRRARAENDGRRGFYLCESGAVRSE